MGSNTAPEVWLCSGVEMGPTLGWPALNTVARDPLWDMAPVVSVHFELMNPDVEAGRMRVIACGWLGVQR